MSEGSEARRPTPLWDGPTRIFHWSLAILIVTAWLSAEKSMEVHKLSGYAIIGLLVFRLWWGVAGGSTARFSSFVRGPSATLNYMRGMLSRKPGETAGHNPVGALSVLLLLAAVGATALLGLYATDIDGIESGPLSDRVDFDTGRLFSERHELAFRAVQVLVVLHLAAIVFYGVWKRENLVRPMVTGSRLFSGPATALRKAPLWSLAFGVALAAGVAWAVSKGFHFKV